MVPADADLRIKLPVFEGPLDLLLFLIRKNELDIYDIPIAAVTKQYIAVLRSMQQLDLEIAGEFFVMAASLMEIKSRMLLPRGQAATAEGEDDDPIDPRWELVHQLLQYKKFKEAAAKLDELASFQRDMLTRHVVEVAVTENERPLKPVDRIELWNAFNLVLRRLSEKLVVGEIKGEEVTVSDKMEELLQIIETRKSFLFTDLFEGKQVTVRLLVATFIAVLELTRLKKLRVRQAEAFADIYVDAVENTVNADGTLAEGQLNFAPTAPEQTSAPAIPPVNPFADDGAQTAESSAPSDESHTETDATDFIESSATPRAEQPPLVLSADGYARIPTVIGANTPEETDAHDTDDSETGAPAAEAAADSTAIDPAPVTPNNEAHTAAQEFTETYPATAATAAASAASDASAAAVPTSETIPELADAQPSAPHEIGEANSASAAADAPTESSAARPPEISPALESAPATDADLTPSEANENTSDTPAGALASDSPASGSAVAETEASPSESLPTAVAPEVVASEPPLEVVPALAGEPSETTLASPVESDSVSAEESGAIPAESTPSTPADVPENVSFNTDESPGAGTALAPDAANGEAVPHSAPTGTAPSDQPAQTGEESPYQNPLDTEPPRNTLKP